MNRTYKTQRRMLEVIAAFEESGMPRDTSLNWERIHLVSCARNAYFLALMRGIDAELAAIACSVHDYGRIVTGKQLNHAAAGREPLQLFLTKCGYFCAEEIDQIVNAATNHSNKRDKGTPLEEIVKDADVFDCYLYGIPLTRAEYKVRLDAILLEMELCPE